jgi:chemotaxis protein methyltransferase CheR
MRRSLNGGVATLMFGRRSPLALYLRLHERIWDYRPASIITSRLLRPYARLLHAVARAYAPRRQNGSTYFFRNRAELDLMRRLVDQQPEGATVKIAVLGCSIGAELYSITWTLRSARPDLRLVVHAVDISRDALRVCREGVYPLEASESPAKTLCERMSPAEVCLLFDSDGESIRIKPWLKEGITWHERDAADPALPELLGAQDIVVANRFLCHMDPPEAERTLRAIARLLRPGGYLFVSGVDLDVRAKVAHELRWVPVADLLEDIHDGDPSLRNSWPLGYWGLEPLDKGRRDWQIRYASAFRVQAYSFLAGLLLPKLAKHHDHALDDPGLCPRPGDLLSSLRLPPCPGPSLDALGPTRSPSVPPWFSRVP